MSFTDAELAEIYDRYAHVVFHRCKRLLGNEEDAHDAVQEVFARVYRSGDSFRGQSSPLTWMYRISTNYCLNQIRNRKTRSDKLRVHRDDIVGEAPPAPDDSDRTDSERILAMLEGLDEQTRRVVVHTFFDDCTRQEVADLVGISVPTVRKRLNTFLERARRQLGVHATALAVLVASVATWSLG